MSMVHSECIGKLLNIYVSMEITNSKKRAGVDCDILKVLSWSANTQGQLNFGEICFLFTKEDRKRKFTNHSAIMTIKTELLSHLQKYLHII